MLLVLSSFALVASAETTTVVVPVTISGEYNGANHWANATYSFDVTDGVAAEFGWISNGEYKFMYYPATGKIMNAAKASSFALEEGKGIPTEIVIPFTIDAFNTDYAEYTAKTITCYAANTNYSIFRNNANANTKIIIPEGTKSIPSSVFGQNNKDNKLQEFIIPSTVTSIGKNAFAQSSSGGIYKEIILPEGLETIGQAAFSNCRFANFTIPSTVVTLNQQAFAYMYNLRTITFKNNLTSLGSETFRKCNRLESITFEGATAPTVSTDAFKEVTATPVVYFPANGTGYTDEAWRMLFTVGTTFERLPGEPVVENLTLTGKTVIGATLMAEYDFIDPLGREERGSTVTWTSCESEDFTSSEVFTLKTESCNGSTPMTYTVQETDDGKYIRCTVTPRNADTTLNVGIPVSIATTTPVRFPKTVPEVTLTAPSDGYYANVNSAITLSAEATCDLTTITKMEFYVNDNKVGEDSEAPYEVSWTPAEMGKAVVYAKAYNALEEDGSSATASVNVLEEGADLSSYITTVFTAPVVNSVNLSNSEVTFTGTTSESSGSEIVSVEIFANASSIGEATITAPVEGSTAYTFTLSKQLAAGKYSIIAIVKSTDGKTGASEAFDITVSGMSFPTMIGNDMVLQKQGHEDIRIWC